MKFFARNQIRNSVSQETKLKTAKHQKNNRLFIPAKQQQLNLNELKGRKRYTSSLYWFTLKPRATSNPQNPLSNQLQITHKHHQRSDLDSLKKHTSFGSTQTPRILTTSRAHNPLGFITPECTKYSERITLVTE